MARPEVRIVNLGGDQYVRETITRRGLERTTIREQFTGYPDAGGSLIDTTETTEAVEQITVAKEDLQALFDVAVNSLDFGSGFWEYTDVMSARRIAIALGVDPDKATPR